MCTVIISVPDDSSSPVRLLAVRDEDPGRPWDRLGPWWPQTHPGVIGIRDARAGGAWLAANEQARTLAVLLNRHDLSDRRDDEVTTRGAVALDAAAGRAVGDSPQTRGFNLVEVTAHTARVTAWDGLCSRTTELPPGIHMVAHDDVDDPETPEDRPVAPRIPGCRSRGRRMVEAVAGHRRAHRRPTGRRPGGDHPPAEFRGRPLLLAARVRRLDRGCRVRRPRCAVHDPGDVDARGAALSARRDALSMPRARRAPRAIRSRAMPAGH